MLADQERRYYARFHIFCNTRDKDCTKKKDRIDYGTCKRTTQRKNRKKDRKKERKKTERESKREGKTEGKREMKDRTELRII